MVIRCNDARVPLSFCMNRRFYFSNLVFRTFQNSVTSKQVSRILTQNCTKLLKLRKTTSYFILFFPHYTTHFFTIPQHPHSFFSFKHPIQSIFSLIFPLTPYSRSIPLIQNIFIFYSILYFFEKYSSIGFILPEPTIA